MSSDADRTETVRLALIPITPPLNVDEISTLLSAVPGVETVVSDGNANTVDIKHKTSTFSLPSAIYTLGETGEFVVTLDAGRIYGISGIEGSDETKEVEDTFRKVSKAAKVDREKGMVVLENVGDGTDSSAKLDDVIVDLHHKGKRIMEWNGGCGVVVRVWKMDVKAGKEGTDEETKEIEKVGKAVEDVKRCVVVGKWVEKEGEGKGLVALCEGCFVLDQLKAALKEKEYECELY